MRVLFVFVELIAIVIFFLLGRYTRYEGAQTYLLCCVHAPYVFFSDGGVRVARTKKRDTSWYESGMAVVVTWIKICPTGNKPFSDFDVTHHR